jgi:hypothetical protein
MGDETLNGVLRNVFTEVNLSSERWCPFQRVRRSTLLSLSSRQFLAGDFEMIRVFVSELTILALLCKTERVSETDPLLTLADALNEGNPGLNLGEETIDNLEGAFRRVREVVLSMPCLVLLLEV